MNVTSRLYDLDELVLKCHGPSARDYIEEAVASYKVGAFRSSIIATWIAVYFDLVDKLRVHSRSGVASATEWVEQFELGVQSFEPGDPKSARKMMAMEAQILGKAADPDIGILTPLECEDLKRLREDRHRCAHPTFLNEVDKFAPTAERARNHIRIAIDSVLAKNAVPGSLMSARILSYCRSTYFPTEANVAREELRSEFGDYLLKQILEPVTYSLLGDIFDTETSASVRRQRVAAISALQQLAPASATTGLRESFRALNTVSDLESWSIAVGLLNQLTWSWDSLDEPQKALVERVVRQVDIGQPFATYIIIQALSHGQLVEVAKERVGSLPLETLDAYIDRLPANVVRDELLQRLVKSTGWRVSERLFTALSKRGELLEDDGYTLAFLQHALKNDQVFTAPKFIEIMKQIISARAFEPLNDEFRQVLSQILSTMGNDHRVTEPEFRSLAMEAAFLLDLNVDVGMES